MSGPSAPQEPLPEQTDERSASDTSGGAPIGRPRLAVPRTAGQLGRQALQVIGSLGLAVVLLGWGLPYLTDTSWSTILGIVTGIGWPTFFGLFGLMMLGLYCYTFTLTASLPGLSHFRAILANLAGSGVSNVLPAARWGRR